MFVIILEGRSSGNGVAYDLILSPKVENARKPHLTPLKGKENKEQLEEKMTAAEMRKKVGNVQTSIYNPNDFNHAVYMNRGEVVVKFRLYIVGFETALTILKLSELFFLLFFLFRV